MSLRVIKMVESLPPFPLLADVLRAFARSDAMGDMRELIDAIKREPTVTGKIIGVANSAYYASGFPVYTVESAAARLGLRQLKITVLSLVLAKRFDPSRCPGFDLGRFWYDAIMTAHCVNHLLNYVKTEPGADRNAMMCIALVHSVGLLLLVEQHPQALSEVIHRRMGEQGVGLSLAEPIFFDGEDHYTVGARLIRHWGLPPVFSAVIGNISQPDKAGSDAKSAALVRFAKQLVDAFAHGAEPPSLDAGSLVRVLPENMISISKEMTRDHEAFTAFLPYLSGAHN